MKNKTARLINTLAWIILIPSALAAVVITFVSGYLGFVILPLSSIVILLGFAIIRGFAEIIELLNTISHNTASKNEHRTELDV